VRLDSGLGNDEWAWERLLRYTRCKYTEDLMQDHGRVRSDGLLYWGLEDEDVGKSSNEITRREIRIWKA
jgi:hypothetical protein